MYDRLIAGFRLQLVTSRMSVPSTSRGDGYLEITRSAIYCLAEARLDWSGLGWTEVFQWRTEKEEEEEPVPCVPILQAHT